MSKANPERLVRNDIERLEIIDLDGSVHYVRRSGLMFAYAHSVPETIVYDVMKIPDFGRADLKRPKAIMDRIRAMGADFETRYDAAHGRRYKLCVYGGAPFSTERKKQRRIAIAAADGITNLRQHHLDCGGTAEELDAIMAKENSDA